VGTDATVVPRREYVTDPEIKWVERPRGREAQRFERVAVASTVRVSRRRKMRSSRSSVRALRRSSLQDARSPRRRHEPCL
jgi:hypothetical protein